MRLVTASEMQKMDRLTIEDVGIPGVVLMENAARTAAGIFLEHFGPARGSRVFIACGRGNNGGDGYVIARYLHEAGLSVAVAVLAPLEKISGDAKINLDILYRTGVEIREIPGTGEWGSVRDRVRESAYLVDGILGTGLNSPVRGLYKTVIEEMNASGRPVMAVDIPSGLHADTGQIMGAAVRSDLTVTFGLPKLGQVIYPGAALTGRLACVDIGIPRAVQDKVPERCRLIEPDDFRALLFEEREDVHKGTRGHLLILAGSTGKTGAAALAALGALRAGAGLVTVGVPEGLNAILENKLTEAMTVPLPQTREGSLSLAAEEKIDQLLDGKSAVAIGPGISTAGETTALVRRLVEKISLPMVIDADGLNSLSEDTEVLTRSRGTAVLTPHPGEMSRLMRTDIPSIQADRPAAASRFGSEHGCCVVLKGARTIIAEPGDMVYVNPTGNSALAAGGTGDVLTGLIGGFLARRWPRLKAALAGVYLHGLAAELLSEDVGRAGVTAGELAGVVPGIMYALERGIWPLKRPGLHETVRPRL